MRNALSFPGNSPNTEFESAIAFANMPPKEDERLRITREFRAEIGQPRGQLSRKNKEALNARLAEAGLPSEVSGSACVDDAAQPP